MARLKPLILVCGSREEAAAYMKYVHRAQPARRARIVEREVHAFGEDIPVFIVAVFERPNVPTENGLLTKGG